MYLTNLIINKAVLIFSNLLRGVLGHLSELLFLVDATPPQNDSQPSCVRKILRLPLKMFQLFGMNCVLLVKLANVLQHRF